MGKSHARTFVREGARVVLTDLRVGAGRSLQQELGEQAIFVEHDATNFAEWNEVIEEAEAAFGPVNVLVNNAGILGAMAKTAELTEQDYLAVCAVNQHSVFTECAPSCPPCRRRVRDRS